MKAYTDIDVLTAARERISYTFDNFEKIYLSFSGGKDSSVMFHLAMEEAIKRSRKIGILIIDLEAQYTHTIDHIEEMIELYKDNIEVFWVCVPMKLRNAVSNYQPTWTAWGEESKEIWIRDKPKRSDVYTSFPFYNDNMEFEEFIVLFGDWYSNGDKTACMVGIRCDESLNRYRTIASRTKEKYDGKSFTTKVIENLYNVYPIYDWKTEDIWRFHAMYPEKPYNRIYEQMNKAADHRGATGHRVRCRRTGIAPHVPQRCTRMRMHAVAGLQSPRLSVIHVSDLVELLDRAAERGQRLAATAPHNEGRRGYYFACRSEFPTILNSDACSSRRWATATRHSCTSPSPFPG